MGTITNNSQPNKHIKEPALEMKTCLVVAACLYSVLVAPQYGPGVSVSQPQRNPSGGSPIKCRTEQTTVWDTTYVETKENVCNTVYVNQCEILYERQCRPTSREVCQTTSKQQCTTNYKEECHEEFRTEYEPYTETECSTTYKEDCQFHWEGTGNDKKWVPDRSTCKNNPYEHCEDVQKQHERQVSYPSVIKSLSKTVSVFQSLSASRFQTKNALMSPTRNATRCLKRNAEWSIRRPHTG